MAQLDYNHLNALSNDAAQLTQALANINAGGRILMMTVGPPPFDPNNPNANASMSAATVQTQGIDYPPQMVDAIKVALTQRYQQVSQEITSLMQGVEPVAAAERQRRPRP